MPSAHSLTLFRLLACILAGCVWKSHYKKKSASREQSEGQEYRKLGYAQRNLNIHIDFAIALRRRLMVFR